MARRGAAVTVNYVADATPLKRGVNASNRYLRRLGKGAQLSKVGRDVAKVTGKLGSLTGGLMRLRMGWFGVGATAGATAGAMVAGISRIGNAYDEAVNTFQRSSGLLIGEVDGVEAAFLRLAGSVPDSMAKSAAAFGAVITDMKNDLEAAGQTLTAGAAANASRITEEYLDAARLTGLANPDLLLSFGTRNTLGALDQAEFLDSFTHLSQTIPQLDARQLLSDMGKNVGLFPHIDAATMLRIGGSIQLHTGDTGKLSLIREAMGRAAAQLGETNAEFMERSDLEIQRRIAEAGDNPVRQRRAVQEFLTAPVKEGGWALTTEVDALTGAFLPETGLLPLRLTEQGYSGVASEAAGARFRGRDETVADTWQETWNYVDAQLGPTARDLVRGAADNTRTAVEMVSEHGWIPTFAATLLEAIGGGEPDTAWDTAATKDLVVDAISELQKQGKFDFTKLGEQGAVRRQEVEDYGVDWAIAYRSMLEQVSDTGLGREGQVESIAVAISGAMGDAWQEWLADAEAAEEAFGNTVRMSGDDFASKVGGAGEEIVDSARVAAQGIYAGSAQAMEILARATSRIVWAAVDAGSIMGSRSPHIDPSKLTIHDAISWDGPFRDNIDAVRSNTRALYELHDGMMTLADGVIFRQHDIVSQTTNDDGITTTVLGDGGVMEGTPPPRRQHRPTAATPNAPEVRGGWPTNALV